MIALDIIKGALRRINSYQSGETIAEPDAQDVLDTLNDLLDSLSNDHCSIVGSTENILQWVPNKNQYNIGNPSNAQLGLPNFTGIVTGGSGVITGVTNIPPKLIVGASLTDTAAVIPPGALVTAIGASTVTFAPVATATPSTGADSIGFTVPGDFAIPRPLRISYAFTRFNQLDFTLDVQESQARFTEILYKAQPGPWPTVGWYNPVMPYGILNVYQTPGNAAELHLYTDTLMQNLTLTQVFFMPQGYARWLKWLLAKEICADYGYPMTEAIKTNANDAEMKIKALNARPAVVSTYDSALAGSTRGDYGWIMHGGYGR